MTILDIFKKFKKTKEISEEKKVKIEKREEKFIEEKKGKDIAYPILLSPTISEKSTDLNKLNKYVFKVSTKANKPEIKKAIEKFYNVKILNVNVMNLLGRRVSRGRFFGKKPDFKKAIVTLREGQKISE